jgi:hypothetical protein
VRRAMVSSSIRRGLTLGVLSAVLCALPPPLQSQDPGLSSRVDAIFENYGRTDSPGYAVGVVQDGRLVPMGWRTSTLASLSRLPWKTERIER